MDPIETKKKPRALRRALPSKGHFSVKYGMSVPPITVPSTYRLNFFPGGDRKKKPKELYPRPVSCPLPSPFATLNDLDMDSNLSRHKQTYRVEAPYGILDGFRKKNLDREDYKVRPPYATHTTFIPMLEKEGRLTPTCACHPKTQRAEKVTPPYALHTYVSEASTIVADEKRQFRKEAPVL